MFFRIVSNQIKDYTASAEYLLQCTPQILHIVSSINIQLTTNSRPLHYIFLCFKTNKAYGWRRRRNDYFLISAFLHYQELQHWLNKNDYWHNTSVISTLQRAARQQTIGTVRMRLRKRTQKNWSTVKDFIRLSANSSATTLTRHSQAIHLKCHFHERVQSRHLRRSTSDWSATPPDDIHFHNES
jgi:hypothetical protein